MNKIIIFTGELFYFIYVKSFWGYKFVRGKEDNYDGKREVL